MIASVARNPRLPTTGAFQRFRVFRPGLTIAQCLARGVKKRDVRSAIKQGYITLLPNNIEADKQRRRSR